MKTRTSFSATKQPKNENKRKPKRKTVLKRAILAHYKEIDDAKDDVLKIYAEALKKGTKSEKVFVAKEVSKYLFPTKQNITGNFDGQINIIFKNIKAVENV